MIAGGLGPVGELLCQELASKYRPTLVILSRGAFDADKAEACRRLERLGASVHYLATDVTDSDALDEAYREIKGRGLVLNGVVHLARLVEDGLLAAKSWSSFERVVAAKVAGTVRVDGTRSGSSDSPSVPPRADWKAVSPSPAP